MRQSSAALLRAAFALLRALFIAPSGRHHRRASRVRRYADPKPATRALPPAVPRLSAPREVFPADDLPLVRPYYTAHEQQRRQAAATARLQQWVAPRIPAPRMPEGDLLAPTPVTFDDLAKVTRVWIAQQERKQAAGVGA
ncbi:hypothetical protein [Nocardiopsis protaetiae]|uniref:hypothetical protein n=1 Tax=Nocardiopsis protaetiae TaxID=3382270 RepID=UPI00387AAD61